MDGGRVDGGRVDGGRVDGARVNRVRRDGDAGQINPHGEKSMFKKFFRKLLALGTRPKSVKIQAVRLDNGCLRLSCMAPRCGWRQTIRAPESDRDISARHAALHLFEKQ